MRLVDANELKHEIVGAIPMMATVRIPIEHKIDAAPTVAAIPVEWLKAHKTEYLDDWGEEPVSVEAALRIWQKEQEAKQ